MSLLEIRDLRVHFRGEGGINHAVDGVSFSVPPGRIVGVVGESGCGKSVTAMSVLRLVPDPPGRIVGGEILWEGRNLLALPTRELDAIRGRDIAMIFQDPMSSLNPVFTIRRILGEVVARRFGEKGRAADARLVAALTEVGISDAPERLAAYPHQLSGGQKQRVMIALALLCQPRLLIADEPTTALDVTIQKQILNLIRSLRDERGMGVVLITHNIGVVAEYCDEVVVMYAGRVVEQCAVADLFARNRHPYTRGLLESLPRRGLTKDQPLATIEGSVPSLWKPPAGCRFATRCSRVAETCHRDDPALRPVAAGHHVACHFPHGEAGA